ncbi:MAG: esterase-like activity of phytase family protein [Blastochloris sp.]|nr:esterase-like activity of phytase family protein [Blastochloris sp.]
MRLSACAVAVCALVNPAAANPASAEQPFPATLAGHALIPAATSFTPPEDAPKDLAISGKFTAPDRRRVDEIGKIAATASRNSGYSLPIKGQPVQGFSGIKTRGEGTFLVLTDNGFGAKHNSADAMLVAHRIRPDWTSGKVTILDTLYLRDPDRKVPFQITLEGTPERYLTGADFDLESIQPIGDKLWFGDEFGPYLIRTERTGKVEAVFEAVVDGKVVRSPDHFQMLILAVPGGKVDFTLGRSRGFEGMAASPDGKFLYPLLEGPLWDTAAGAWESVDGKAVLRILEFSTTENKWTGRFWFYPLELAGNSIGDFNMIDPTMGLIIERDNGEGSPALACPKDSPRPDCFSVPATFKRLYKIELTDAAVGKPVRKVGYIDLMAIRDPKGLARQGAGEGRLTFPFVTIESVDRVDDTHIIVANDNNFPFSAGRKPQTQDDNEFVLLEVGALLAAK